MAGDYISYPSQGGGGGGSGTVTSVALSLPASTFAITGSPVTISGTLAGSFKTQNANIVLAGPTSGAAATPTWRALVVADIPVLTASRVVVSDGSGLYSASSVTTTTLGYLDATSSIQTQLNAKAPTANPTFTGTVLVDKLGVGASPSASTNLLVRGTGTTGTDQRGLIVDSIFQSDATGTGYSITAQVQTAAAAFTMATGAAFRALTATIDTGSSATRLINYYGVTQTAGTNNAFLTDNLSFTGNYFINQSGTTASVFGGAVQAPANYHVEASEVDDGNSSTADTIDWSTGSAHKSTLTGNVTYTFSNPVTGGSYILRVLTGAGSFTATWPAAVKWAGGAAPVVTTTASRMDLFSFYFDGTNYYGTYSQNYTP